MGVYVWVYVYGCISMYGCTRSRADVMRLCTLLESGIENRPVRESPVLFVLTLCTGDCTYYFVLPREVGMYMREVSEKLAAEFGGGF